MKIPTTHSLEKKVDKHLIVAPILNGASKPRVDFRNRKRLIMSHVPALLSNARSIVVVWFPIR